MITSKTNQKLKMVRKLMENSRLRKETGFFVAEGERLCAEIPPELLVCVYASEEYADAASESSGKILADAGPERTEVVERSVFRSLSDTMNPQGILAVVRIPVREEKPDLNAPGKILLLDGVRDPGNLGTIIRTAEAAGVKAVYMSSDCVDLYNPKVIRSTMGSIFRVNTYSADLEEVIDDLKTNHVPVYGTSLAAEKSYRDVDLSGAAIIIGSEANGAREQVLAKATCCIKIPMAGKVESLNAAVSAAILMFS